MRLLVLCTLAALTADAQTADPNPPWSYDPVEVGNVRSYALEDGARVVPSRTDSPASVTLDGHRWVVRRTQRFSRTTVLGVDGWSRAEDRVLVRYDTSAANVVVRDLEGAERMLYPCRLDLPVPPAGASAPCGDGASYRVDLEVGVEVGDRVVRTAVRSFDGAVLGPSLAAGIGEVAGAPEGSEPSRLVGAVVGGDTLAVEPEWFPPSRPDPVPGWRYTPLADGNEWQYEYGRSGIGVDEVEWHRMGGLRSVVDRLFHTVSRSICSLEGCVGLLEELYVRYDTLSGYAVGPLGVDFRYGEVPDPFLSPCPLDEPVNPPGANEPVFCSTTNGAGVWASSRGGRRQQETGVVVESESFKVFHSEDLSQGGPLPPVFAAGVGYLPRAGSPFTYAGLRFARVRQPGGSVLEVGRRYAVAMDDASMSGAFALEVGPSPTAGPLTVALEAAAPSTVTVEVFDALGRRIDVLEVAVAGLTQVALDGSRWAPGLYLVRARSGREAATATVVRR